VKLYTAWTVTKYWSFQCHLLHDFCFTCAI